MPPSIKNCFACATHALGISKAPKSVLDIFDDHASKKTTAYHYDNSNHVSSATIDPDRSPYQYYSAVEQERRYKNSTAYKQAQIQEKRYRNSTAYKIAEHKEKQKQKIIDLKKQRENDRNRTSNFGPDQDPDDDDDDDEIIEEIVDVIIDATVDAIADKIEDVSKFIYEGNPKHHLNSQGNRSKPPHDGPNSLKKSVWVKTNSNGLSQRVGIENGNVVIFKEHAPNKYHGYIETKPTEMPQIFKNTLYKNKLITDTRSCKITIKRK